MILSKLKELFHAIGFWFLIILLIGIYIGGCGMHLYQKSRMNEAISLNGFIFNNKVFEIKLRP